MSLMVTVVCAEAPPAIVAEPGVRDTVGGSFAAVTVSVNVREAVRAPSLTVTVIAALPY